jgi:hypothetical protein
MEGIGKPFAPIGSPGRPSKPLKALPDHVVVSLLRAGSRVLGRVAVAPSKEAIVFRMLFDRVLVIRLIRRLEASAACVSWA